MNAKKEKFENILSQNLPNLKKNLSRIEDKELINIQINNSETNKKSKTKKIKKNSQPIKKIKKGKKI